MDKSTRDIFFAAFLMSQGINISGYHRDGRITMFEFSIDEMEWKNFKVKYMCSKHCEIESQIKKLKELGRQ